MTAEQVNTEPVNTEQVNTGPAVRHAWDGGERRWDAYFAVVLVGNLALIQVVGSPTGQERLIASAALVAMVLWYLLLGRRAIYGSGVSVWPGVIYLAGLVALLAVAEANAGSVALILLALGPQAFMAAGSYRLAVVAVVLMNVPTVFTAVAKGARGADLTASIAVAALTTVFSIMFGTWINRIIDQSRERAELIEQLERTRAELAEANREAGRLAERDRLASEIHDTIAQGFTSIVMLVQAAEALIGEDTDRARKQLDLIGKTARENLAEARALVAGLTPAPLAAASLADALARLADRAGEDSGLRADFKVIGTPRPVETNAEVVLLRVCQEALANVRRHAAATSIRVALSYRHEGVALAVTDDGTGFDPDEPTSGYGLRGMRARVSEIGGSLEVRSEPGAGTTVTAEVP
ncbi:MAG: sensor histidine kinase [Streptosporangiaceae bacterium]